MVNLALNFSRHNHDQGDPSLNNINHSSSPFPRVSSHHDIQDTENFERTPFLDQQHADFHFLRMCYANIIDGVYPLFNS